MSKPWARVKFKELCQVERNQGHYSDLPYVGLEDIESNSGRYIGSKVPRQVRSSTFRFRANHVLYGRLRPYLNKVCIAGFEGHCSTEIIPIAVNERVLKEYVTYWLMAESTVKAIDETSTGARMPRAQMDEVMEFELPLPPISEQKRIVTILDQALATSGIAREATNRSLMKTNDLFASYLHKKLYASADKWQYRRLGDVVTRLTNGYVGPTRNIYHDNGVPYLLARHVKNNTLLFDGRTFVSDAFNRKNGKSILKKGDVLLVQSGHIGHCAVVPQEHEGHNCHAMIVITPAGNILDGQFLSWYFAAPETQKEFWRIRTGSTVPHLNCGNVQELRVPVPPIGEQESIAEEIDEVRSYASRLGDICRRKLSAMAMLRNSLFSSAMSGAL